MADIVIQYNRPDKKFSIFCYVQNNNVSQTGLTDVYVDVFKWDKVLEVRGTQVLTSQILSEVNSSLYPGWYAYEWTTFDWLQDYVCDYYAPTLGINGIDIEYFNVSEFGQDVANLDLLIDMDTDEMYKTIINSGNVGIIQKVT